ncbi:MAG: TRAP transporter small permease [Thermodesulfobacteriota bacterium]|nr:TRAP transporter small permease [Thermodesulfobacteriota bacterium]
MEHVMTLAHRLGRYSLWFSGALILISALLIGVDVVMRKFFRSSIGGADELAGYALAIGTSWSLGAALLDRVHIRIDSLYGFLPRWLRLALDLPGLALFVGFFGLIAWRAWSVAQQSWVSASRSHSALAVPTVIPQSVWLAGLALLIVVGAALFLRAVILIARGEMGAATLAIGTRSAPEEIQEEVRIMKERGSEEVVR